MGAQHRPFPPCSSSARHFRVDLVPHETQEIPSPASSIKKLGFVRFCPEEPADSGGARRIRVIELPSFALQPERPRVKMQPLIDRWRAWTENDSVSEPAPHAAPGDDPATSGSQRVRTSTLQGVEPFPVRPRGSSPAIEISACDGTPVAVGSALAANDGTPTDLDLAPIPDDGTPTDLDLAPIACDAAPVPVEPASGPVPAAELTADAPVSAAELATDPALMLLHRIRRLTPRPATDAERAVLRRLRRLTRPRASGSSRFDALADGSELVIDARGARAARAGWHAAIVGAAVAVGAAVIGLATLL